MAEQKTLAEPMADDESPEEISDQFLCCVCLELLYKPIALSCGHLSCFWCVHKSMNGFRESHCPICRYPFVHFPSVCQKLHFLLKKIYPLAHKKREEQVLNEEQELDCFSPQIDVVLDEPKAMDESVCCGDSLNVSDPQKVEECSNAAKLLSTLPSRACKELLVRPVVLNCGHVYCEGCVVDMAEESEKIKCQECHVYDPRGFPKVCLVLDQLLEENFPEEYNSRRSGIQKAHAHTSKGNIQSFLKEGTLPVNNNNDMPQWLNPKSKVHFHAGCDSCGVHPIIGDRYRCKDCKEKMGYDLCKDCYDTPSKVPGRFNQQHTPDHRFELAEVPQLRINLNAIGFLLGPMVNSIEGGGSDDGEERPHGSSNESSSTE
ncbi:E3 ubiquitin-protein ligase PRT1 [Cardamine amara subsp. amara]|uniref:E3 ubiquitin-protein ligase PRT1 n=1 Tax=Cardamine amara subsp. amara TaxID=228776 RepID=A0ABD0Z7A0_CARAN